ncbi:tetratricopeptide repeat protein [Micromonospora sp. CPCC 206061]|uniref:tetratricopeptide repeat protein n=1 Tax=Micromonospora sp. CPCC 206061 TaxID=3122410 RepID=UPI002FF3CCB0
MSWFGDDDAASQMLATAVASARNGDPRLAVHVCQQILADPGTDLGQRFQEVDRLREAVATNTLAWLLLGSFQVDFAIDTGVDLDRVRGWLLPMRQRADEHLRARPAELEVHELRSVILVHLGDVAARTGGVLAGRDFYLEALEGAQVLAAAHPSEPRWQRRLGLVHTKIGNLAAERGELEEATAAYRESLRLAKAMVATVPEIALDDVAISHGKLAQMASRLGDRDTAREHLEAAREAAERRVGLVPGDPDALRSLSIVLERIGDLALETDDLETARIAYHDNFRIVESLVRADPGHSGWQYDLAVCHQRLGMLAMAAGDLAAARKEHAASVAVGERLAAALPDELMLVAHLAAGYANLSSVAAQRADYAEAAELLGREAAVLADLMGRDPGNPRWPARLEENRQERAELDTAPASRPPSRWPFGRRRN